MTADRTKYILKGLLRTLAVGLFFVPMSGGMAGTSPSPMPSPEAMCSCPCTGAPGEVRPVVLLAKSETRKLLKEFQKAQRTEMDALVHRQKSEIRELKSSQKARRKEWEGREREARRKYFDEHPHGPDKRAYVQDLVQRRKALDALLKEELTQREREHDVRRKAIKDDQALRLKEFGDYLGRGQRPPEKLWPDRSF